MLTLAFTSSTGQVGIAVAENERVLARAVSADERRHAEDVTPLMVEVLAEADVALADLDRLAVDVGPGRFTGLRVGLATVRGLAMALGCGVVGVSSLELLAAAEPEECVVAVIDARRREVFQQIWQGPQPLAEPVVAEPETVLSLLPPGALIVGDGADRYAELYDSVGELRRGREPSPEVLAALASQREPEVAAQVAPRYLRDPDVQINIKTRP